MRKIEGLKFFDYYSESVSEQKRCTGNIIIKVKLEDEEFETFTMLIINTTKERCHYQVTHRDKRRYPSCPLISHSILIFHQ